MTNSKLAITNFFNCETTEDSEAFTKVRVVAEIVLDFREIHHVNTDEVKYQIQKAVQDAVWFKEKSCKPKEGDNAK